MQQTDLSKARARAQRQDLPLAERRLWDALRNRRFLGLKVRRQVPMAGHIVDFYIPEKGLVIDLDGVPDRQALDLQAQGFCLLRLQRAVVAADLPGALARIAAACRLRIDPPGPI